MKQNTYLSIIGILSFIFGTIQLIIIINYPMIGYLIYKTVQGSYSINQYKRNIPIGAYIITVLLFAMTIAITVMMNRNKKNPEKIQD